jgi:hypothetical protein
MPETGSKATLLARRAENDARKTGEREEKGDEEIRAKRQRPTACNRMATLRTPFVFAAPGRVGANSLNSAGRNPMATKELVVAPKVVGLGPGGPDPGHVVRAGSRTAVDPHGGPGRGARRAVSRVVDDVRYWPPRRRTAKMVVLIPAHNEQASIGNMLNALLAQTRVPDRIVVIADHCTDETEQIARRSAGSR